MLTIEILINDYLVISDYTLSMKPKKRQSKIIDIIRQQGRVTVDDLVAIFETSAETIRRDLSTLSKKGRIQKIHGGATLPASSSDGPFKQRIGENVEAKRQIAQKASQLIQPSNTILIATGSSTLIFVEEILHILDLTIITNSLEISNVIADSKNNAKVFLLGGEYSSAMRATHGPIAIAQLSRFHADHAIMSASAVDAVNGVMGFDFNEVTVENAMLNHAENTILLVDSSKFSRVAPYTIGKLNQFDQLICNEEPKNLLKESLADSNVDIICANEICANENTSS